jgi:hypothetical protein
MLDGGRAGAGPDAVKSRILWCFAMVAASLAVCSAAQTAILGRRVCTAEKPTNMRHIIAIHLQNEAGALTR